MDALWAEASMAAEPPGGTHSGDSSGGSAGRWASKGLGGCSLKICLSRLSQGTVRCGGGLGASEQEVAGAEASIMGVVCSRCVAPWHGQGEVAVPTVSTALGSSAEL